jgi:hypothetical protein
VWGKHNRVVGGERAGGGSAGNWERGKEQKLGKRKRRKLGRQQREGRREWERERDLVFVF